MLLSDIEYKQSTLYSPTRSVVVGKQFSTRRFPTVECRVAIAVQVMQPAWRRDLT